MLHPKEVRLKLNEMEAVGKTFNKLDAFLQTVQKAEEEAKKQMKELIRGKHQRRQVMAPDKHVGRLKVTQCKVVVAYRVVPGRKIHPNPSSN